MAKGIENINGLVLCHARKGNHTSRTKRSVSGKGGGALLRNMQVHLGREGKKTIKQKLSDAKYIIIE